MNTAPWGGELPENSAADPAVADPDGALARLSEAAQPDAAIPTPPEPDTVRFGDGVQLGRERRPVPEPTKVAISQHGLLAFVAGLVVGLVALGVSPYVAVSTAFAAGVAVIELLRRAA